MEKHPSMRRRLVDEKHLDPEILLRELLPEQFGEKGGARES